jgi:hypothetical protein
MWRRDPGGCRARGCRGRGCDRHEAVVPPSTARAAPMQQACAWLLLPPAGPAVQSGPEERHVRLDLHRAQRTLRPLYQAGHPAGVNLRRGRRSWGRKKLRVIRPGTLAVKCRIGGRCPWARSLVVRTAVVLEFTEQGVAASCVAHSVVARLRSAGGWRRLAFLWRSAAGYASWLTTPRLVRPVTGGG